MKSNILPMPQSATAVTPYYKFKIYLEEPDRMGSKTKSIGMGYLREGEKTYTLRLWTFMNTKFYMTACKSDSSKYLVFSREESANPLRGSKFFWAIVGSGYVDTTKGHIELFFDLFSKPICVSIFPESLETPKERTNPNFDLTA